MTYTVAPSEKVIAHFRNGESFVGQRLAFIPSQYTKHDFIVRGAQQLISGDLGRRPAVSVLPAQTGLGILVVESVTSRLRYPTWAKFQAFVDHKDLDITQAEHVARGYPPTDFRERYRRFAKSLVGVGDAIGADRRVGLEIELVALANPYVDDLTGGLPVQAFLGDAARADVQIELFEKRANGEIDISLHRTDDKGMAVLPVRAGSSYLVDTVHLRPAPADSKEGVVWQTLWASLTFAVP